MDVISFVVVVVVESKNTNLLMTGTLHKVTASAFTNTYCLFYYLDAQSSRFIYYSFSEASP